ncbi:MAG: hypothetical protein EBV76_08570 [Gammaproteobacteria bacterium]|nr:hypothetical protein [Gammaproteobacteria bacterium]
MARVSSPITSSPIDLEALLVQHGVLPAGAVESFAPSAEEVQSRLTEHRNLIEAVARDLQHR